MLQAQKQSLAVIVFFLQMEFMSCVLKLSYIMFPSYFPGQAQNPFLPWIPGKQSPWN